MNQVMDAGAADAVASLSRDVFAMGKEIPLGFVPAKMHAWTIRRERHGIQMTGYAGWPVVMAALDSMSDGLSSLVDSVPGEDRSGTAETQARDVNLSGVARCTDALGREAPAQSTENCGREALSMIRAHVLNTYEQDVFSRPGLEPSTSTLVKLGALSMLARECDAPGIRFYASAAKRAGIQLDEVREAIWQVTPYATPSKIHRSLSSAQEGTSALLTSLCIAQTAASSVVSVTNY